MNPLLVATFAMLLDVAAIAAVTVLAATHVIPGATAVVLIAPYLALRATRRPPPSSGAGPGGEGGAPRAFGSGGGLARAMMLAASTAVLRVFDPLAEASMVAAGVAGVVHLVLGSTASA